MNMEVVLYPPPAAQTPIVLVKAKQAYGVWHRYLINLARMDRYTVGVRIDETFLTLLELIFRASFAADKFEKLSCLTAAIAKADLLKFLLQLAWEEKALDHRRYGTLTLDLDEIGRMLGGWKRMVSNKPPARK